MKLLSEISYLPDCLDTLSLLQYTELLIMKEQEEKILEVKYLDFSIKKSKIFKRNSQIYNNFIITKIKQTLV